MILLIGSLGIIFGHLHPVSASGLWGNEGGPETTGKSHFISKIHSCLEPGTCNGRIWAAVAIIP